MFKKNGKYDRIAKYYDKFDSFYETKVYHKMREKYILALENSKILEIGVGTGKNLEYYKENNEILAIDRSIGMLKEAKNKLESLSKEQKSHITLRQLSDDWNLKTNYYNYIVATFVLCTNSDPTNLISKIYSHLKPAGQVILFEWIPSKRTTRHVILKLIHPFLNYFLGVSVYRNPSLEYFDKSSWDLVKKEFFDSENAVIILQKKSN